MATWPATLPAPLTQGYQLAPVDQTARTEMEAGAPRARRRTTVRNDVLSVSWQFTDSQMAAFRTWFEDGTSGAAGGAGWFTMNVLIGTGGTVSMTARFVGPYKASYTEANGGAWKVSAQVEVR